MSYIVIEGGDGTGKSTVIDALAKKLKYDGQEVVIVHEPGGNQIAEQLRTIIKNGQLKRQPITNLLMFTAARAEAWHDVIKPALDAGKTVISSRNWFSSWVYQGYAEDLGTDYVEKLSEMSLDNNYLWPDYSIILTLDHKISLERVKKRPDSDKNDTFETKPEDFHQKVNDGYIKLAKKFNLPTVDASQPPEKVLNEVLKIINS